VRIPFIGKKLQNRCSVYPLASEPPAFRTVTPAYWYSFFECVSSIKRILLLRKI